VQITPLGKFLYSAEKGFEGMAEKVMVSGKANKRRVIHEQQQTRQELQQQKHKLESTQLKRRCNTLIKAESYVGWCFA